MRVLWTITLTLAVLASVALANPHRRLVVRQVPSFFEISRRARQVSMDDLKREPSEAVAKAADSQEESTVTMFDLEVLAPADEEPKGGAKDKQSTKPAPESKQVKVQEKKTTTETPSPVNDIANSEDTDSTVVTRGAAAEEAAEAEEQAEAVNEFQELNFKLNSIMDRIELMHEMLSAIHESKSIPQ